VKRFILGVTSASGAACARSLLQALARHPDVEGIHVVLSTFALQTLRHELDVSIRTEAAALRALLGETKARRGKPAAAPRARVILHGASDMAAPISSGTFRTDGMVVVPCSGGTLAAIANGISVNLLQRAAEVTLKERRPLILAHRDAPLSLIQIENMARATRAGAVVCPLTPPFYTRPRRIEEIVEQITARLLDLLRLEHSLGTRWGSSR
jgi:4-hydroxy-3-polyprenylbenzoate decarboxylase